MNNCHLHQHLVILVVLIIIIGGFAGYINSLRYGSPIQLESTSEIKAPNRWRYVFSGIGASILVPLFLNMLSSNLIKFVDNYDMNNYFVFAGFCFIAGYFSDKFIDSIGDKLLKEIQQTKDKVESTNSRLEQTSKEVKENTQRVEALVDNDSEIDDEELNNKFQLTDLKQQTTTNDDEVGDQIKNITKAFKGKYKFRSSKGISKELNYPLTIVELILNGLEQQGAVKRLNASDGSVVWALTRIGQLMHQDEVSNNS